MGNDDVSIVCRYCARSKTKWHASSLNSNVCLLEWTLVTPYKPECWHFKKRSPFSGGVQWLPRQTSVSMPMRRKETTAEFAVTLKKRRVSGDDNDSSSSSSSIDDVSSKEEVSSKEKPAWWARSGDSDTTDSKNDSIRNDVDGDTSDNGSDGSDDQFSDDTIN
jgi:hypothetical protein